MKTIPADAGPSPSPRPSTRISRVVLIGIEHSRLGGVAGFMNTLAHGFLGRGYDVEIVGIQPSPPQDHYDFKRDPRIHVRTIYDQIPPPWVLVQGLARLNPLSLLARRRWERARMAGIERLRPIAAAWGAETLVICTQILAMEHLLAAGVEPGHPDGPFLIAQYHGSREMSATVGSIVRLQRSYAEADRLLALTATDAEEFRTKDGLNNTGSIPNPIPSARHRAIERRDEVVSLNRYDEQKSLDWLLRAWAVLAPEFPTWRLRLYGEGPLRADLQRLIDELGIGSSARLEGITTDPEAALQGGKIYAMSSQYEGLPLTIAEAAQAGVPTVSFDCAPGIRELIEDGVDGIIVPQNHLAALVEGLRRLMQDDALRDRMGARAQEHAARFHLDRVLDRWEDEMRRLTGVPLSSSAGGES